MKWNTFFAPMLLQEEKEPFDSSLFLYELKFDGIRATVHVGPNTFSIYNRRGNEITDIYPELKKIQELVNVNTIFDGEIVFLENKKPSFSKLLERSHVKDKRKIKYLAENHPVCFIAFDILYQEKELINKSLIERKKILEQIPDNDCFIKALYVIKEGKKLFEKVKEKDLEGIVAKKIDSQYEIGIRTNNWLKIKNLKQETFYVGGYQEEENKPMVRLFLGEYNNNNFCYVGKVMVGKKSKFYQKLITAERKRVSPFWNFKEPRIKYLVPDLTCEVSYLERTEKNSLRQPIFKK